MRSEKTAAGRLGGSKYGITNKPPSRRPAQEEGGVGDQPPVALATAAGDPSGAPHPRDDNSLVALGSRAAEPPNRRSAQEADETPSRGFRLVCSSGGASHS